MNIQIMEILFKFNFDFTSSFVTLIWQSIKIGRPTSPHSKTAFIHEFSTWYTFLHLGKRAHVLSRWQSRIFLSCSLTERFMIQDRFNVAFVWVVYNEGTMSLMPMSIVTFWHLQTLHSHLNLMFKASPFVSQYFFNSYLSPKVILKWN